MAEIVNEELQESWGKKENSSRYLASEIPTPQI